MSLISICLPHLERSKHASVLTIASVSALEVDVTAVSAYGPMKVTILEPPLNIAHLSTGGFDTLHAAISFTARAKGHKIQLSFAGQVSRQLRLRALCSTDIST